MQRPPEIIPNDVVMAAANWLSIAIQNNDYFTHPDNSAGGARIFGNDFDYAGLDKNKIQTAGAALNIALGNPQNEQALLRIYHELEVLSAGMRNGLNQQNVSAINDYKKTILTNLMTNPNFEEVWDKVNSEATKKFDDQIAKLQSDSGADHAKEIAELQQQRKESLEKMELKVIGSLVYKVQSEAVRILKAKNQPEMDRGDYTQAIKAINAYDTEGLLKREQAESVRDLTGRFDVTLAAKALNENKEKNANSYLDNMKTTLANLHKLDEFGKPAIRHYTGLGEFGKTTVNQLLINYVEAIKQTNGDNSLKEKFLQELSSAIHDHLKKNVLNSNDPATQVATKELLKTISPYLSKELQFSLEKRELPKSPGNRDLKSSTAMMFNTTASPEELDKMRKREAHKEEARKDAPLRMQLAKREPLKAKHDVLAPSAPQSTVGAKNTAEAPTVSATRKP